MNIIKKIFRALARPVAVITLGCALFVSEKAEAFVVPSQNPNFIGLTNLPPVLTATNATTGQSNIITLNGCGLGLSGRFASPAVAPVGSGAVVWFSVDGTNYPAPPIMVLVNANASAGVYAQFQTNWSAGTLDGFASAKIILTNANAANMTNAGVVARKQPRPQ